MKSAESTVLNNYGSITFYFNIYKQVFIEHFILKILIIITFDQYLYHITNEIIIINLKIQEKFLNAYEASIMKI